MRTLSLSLALWLGLSAGSSKAAPNPEAGTPIDLVICLDISGSMDGLIDSAKLKLWDIVNDLAKIKPTPVFRVALYSYGCDAYDSKTGWIKKEIDLTTDLDEVYKKLNALRTNGGTEYHVTVAKRALDEIQWAADKNALKIIFVCGNEELQQDKTIKMEDVAEQAKKNNVFINTIHCANTGHHDDGDWHRFALMSGGKGMNIDQAQARQEVYIPSPFDKELVTLNEKLNKTYVAYGKKEAREEKALNQVQQDAAAALNAPQANLSRIASKGGALYRNDAWDLVDRCKNDKTFDVTKLKPEELPDELKKLKPEELKKLVDDKLAERESINKEIQKLSAQRDAHVAQEREKQRAANPQSAADKAWDVAIRAALKEQCKARGIELPVK